MRNWNPAYDGPDGIFAGYGEQDDPPTARTCGDTCGGDEGCSGICLEDLPEAFRPHVPLDPENSDHVAECDGWNLAASKGAPLYLTMRDRAEKAEQRFDALVEANMEQFKAIGKAERERDALKATLHELLTGPTFGFSDATADRMIQDTLREARGET